MVSTHRKNIGQIGNLPQYRGENNSFLKPPPSIYIYIFFFSHVCFFQLTFPTRLSFPESIGPWHDRFSRSKGQSDVPKCDQWPPRQPPKEVFMLAHLRASAPITTCCVHMLFYLFYVDHHPLKGGEGQNVTVHFNVCKTSLLENWKKTKRTSPPHRSPSIF